MWVRQIASNSNVRIVAPTPAAQIRALTVTPDGSFVDFVRRESNRLPALWRVPFLGGTSRKLVDEAVSAPGWSPDGKQMAFLTSTSANTETHVVVAEADGSRPRVPSRMIILRIQNPAHHAVQLAMWMGLRSA